MRRVRDTRLSRLAAERTRFDSATGLDCCMLRAWSTVCGIVRDHMVQAGIDPACVAALQLGGTVSEMADPGEVLEVLEVQIGGRNGTGDIAHDSLPLTANGFGEAPR